MLHKFNMAALLTSFKCLFPHTEKTLKTEVKHRVILSDFFRTTGFILLSPTPVYCVFHTFLVFANFTNFCISPENGLLCTIS